MQFKFFTSFYAATEIEVATPKKTLFYARYNSGLAVDFESASDHKFPASGSVKDVKKFILEDEKNLKGKRLNLSLIADMSILLSVNTPLTDLAENAIIYYDVQR